MAQPALPSGDGPRQPEPEIEELGVVKERGRVYFVGDDEDARISCDAGDEVRLDQRL